MSGDAEQEYFVDGIVEDIITGLSRIKWLHVVARNSTFTYKGRAVDVKEVGRELDVRYVVEGSVRKSGNRVRITGQLIDAIAGTHLWADRFDGSLDDIFDLQDKVALSVAGVIEPTLQAAEILRAAGRPTNDLTAYDLYLRALSRFLAMQPDGLAQALELLSRVIERDPQFAPALGLMSEVHVYRYANGWVDDPQAATREAIELARRAVRVGSDDPETLGRAAYALGFFGEDIDSAIGLIDRSLVLNPSSADGWRRSGLLRLYAGQCDRAIEHLETSLRLDPRAIHAHQRTGIGRAHFFAGRFDEAVANLTRAAQELPSYVTPYRFLAACYAHMGRLAEAHEVFARVRRITPKVLGLDMPLADAPVPYRNPEHRELLLSGLRLAAGETA
jgi:TolB-like protein